MTFIQLFAYSYTLSNLKTCLLCLLWWPKKIIFLHLGLRPSTSFSLAPVNFLSSSQYNQKSPSLQNFKHPLAPSILLLCSHPNHLSLASLGFIRKPSHPSHVMLLHPVLSILMVPQEKLWVFTSALSSFASIPSQATSLF